MTIQTAIVRTVLTELLTNSKGMVPTDKHQAVVGALSKAGLGTQAAVSQADERTIKTVYDKLAKVPILGTIVTQIYNLTTSPEERMRDDRANLGFLAKGGDPTMIAKGVGDFLDGTGGVGESLEDVRHVAYIAKTYDEVLSDLNMSDTTFAKLRYLLLLDHDLLNDALEASRIFKG